jgi:hypothetical protein
MARFRRAAPGQIFISYRLETAYLAGLLYDRLSNRFGSEHVFRDDDSIKAGADYRMAIREAISKCDIFLVLIGPDWSGRTNRKGRRQIDEPNDWVRVEIEAALRRHIPVIIVLVGDAILPQANDLPESLRPLTQCQALPLRPEYTLSDIDQLLATIQATLTGSSALVAASTGIPKTRRRLRWPKISLSHQPKIFLCYRRKDTQWFAGRIYDSLVSKYGHEQVFRDIDSTQSGVRYPAVIESRVNQSSVMIVLIGASWSSSKDDTGQRRLDSPKDLVRQEIETALKHNIPIIPVLMEGAHMPSEDELPPSIADLAEFETAEVTDRRWEYDVRQLIQAIDNLSASG